MIHITPAQPAPEGAGVDAVLVPRSELRMLDNARETLWDLAYKYGLNRYQMAELEIVTKAMYVVAKRRCPDDVTTNHT